VYPVGQEWLARLLERYGAKVEALLEAEGKDAGQWPATLPDFSVGKLRYVLAEEDVLHLDDLLLHRTMLGVLGRITPDCLREIAQSCAAVLGWSAQETISPSITAECIIMKFCFMALSSLFSSVQRSAAAGIISLAKVASGVIS
jgi:glycerol-3-phosphate dehydrogenase